MAKQELRNRANAQDRPGDGVNHCREVPLESPSGKKCKLAGGHSHVFERGDRYGCCTVCGDEVLT